MHSSRMRTVRSSSRLCSRGVVRLCYRGGGCWGACSGGGCLLQGVPALGGRCLLQGVPASGGCLLQGGWGACSRGGAWSGGCLVRGRVSCIPACTEANPPVNRMTDRQVSKGNLRNFVADGKYILDYSDKL